MTTEHDLYATHESLRLSGVRVRRIRLYDDARDASEDEIVSRVQRAVTSRHVDGAVRAIARVAAAR